MKLHRIFCYFYDGIRPGGNSGSALYVLELLFLEGIIKWSGLTQGIKFTF